MKHKFKYRLCRFHRHYKAGYVAFACGMLDVALAIMNVCTGDYVHAYLYLCFAVLIIALGVMMSRIAYMRRLAYVVAEKAWHVAFREGAESYAQWLSEREKKENDNCVHAEI